MNTTPSIWLLLLLILLNANFARAEKIYVTEAEVQVDRCACAWFILRFLDPEAEFKFFKQGEKPPQGIGFDYYGAPYFHKGIGCSFTAFIKKHPREKATDQQALVALEALVNDNSGWRQGPKSLSASLQSAIREIAQKQEKANDQKAVSECLLLFDYLHAVARGQPDAKLKERLFAQLQSEGNKNIEEHFPLTLKLIKDIEKQGISTSSIQKKNQK